MQSDPPAQLAVRFLRSEAFYLAVVLFVVVLCAAQSIQYLRQELDRRNPEAADAPPPPPPTAGENADLKELRHAHDRFIAQWRRADPNRVAFPLWLNRFQISLFIAGATLAVCMAVFGFIHGRYPKVEIIVRPAWNLWDCFKAAACWSAGGLVFGMIFGASSTTANLTLPAVIAALFVAVFLIGIIFNIVAGERRAALRDLGLHAERLPQAIVAALAAFLILQPTLYLIEAAQLRLLHEMPLHNTLQTLLISTSKPVLLVSILGAVVAAPIVEELFFRAFLQPVLQQWFGPWRGLLLCALFFAIVHRHLYVIIPLFALGVALGYVYNRTRSLVAPIVLHMMCNTLAVLTLLSFRHALSHGP